VQLILDYDRADIDPRGNLRVAAMQSQVGQLLLGRLSEKQRNIVLGKNKQMMKKKMDKVKQGDDDAEDDDDEVEYKSIVVITPTTTHLNSNACLHIGHELSGPLRILSYIAGIIPTFIRDILYKLLSKNRKRLFGSSAECRLWDDNWETRFVDDAVVTGGQSMVESMDPFADPSSAAAVVENTDTGDNAQPLLHPGDIVRVVMGTSAEPPVVHTHIPGYDNGICTIGSVGTVTRVLDERAYPKNVAVKFDLDVGGYCDDENNDSTAATTTTASGGDSEVERKGTTTCSFEAHFFPWQLRKE
jgi:predicted DCC family thiol-disulfide oxidoreductase YuxK